MTIYTVAKDGTGTHSTIQAAVNVAVAGDIVQVKNGIYNEQVSVKSSGTSTNWITFTNYSGHTPIIDGTGINMGSPPDYGLITSVGKSYIKIIGFRINNSGQYGIDVRGNFTDVIIQNNYVYNSQAAGMTITGGSGGNLGNSFNLVIDGNTLDTCHTRNIMGDGHEGMSLSEGITNFEIKNNHFINGYMGNIDVKNGVFNGLIYNNLCEASDYSFCYVDGYYYGVNNIKIYQNVVKNMTNNEFDDAVSGIVVSSEQTTGNTYNVWIYNNLIYKSSGDAFYIPAYLQGQCHDIYFTSNTCYHNGYDPSNNTGRQYRGGAVVDAGYNIYVRNNIFADNYDFQIWNSIGTSAIIENNLIYGFRSRYGQETRGINYIEADPKFLSTTIPDFHLQSTSPAINAGSTTQFYPLTDYDNITRSSPPDIGAFEYVGTPPACPIPVTTLNIT